MFFHLSSESRLARLFLQDYAKTTYNAATISEPVTASANECNPQNGTNPQH